MPRNPLVQVRLKPEDFDLLREAWADQGPWPEFLRTRLLGIPAKADPGIPPPSEAPGIPVPPGIPAAPVRTAEKKKVERVPKIAPRPHYCRQDRLVAGGWYCSCGALSTDNGRTWR